MGRSCWPRIRWCRTGGFQEQGQCFFIGLSCYSSNLVFYCFPFLFVLSIGWYYEAMSLDWYSINHSHPALYSRPLLIIIVDRLLLKGSIGVLQGPGKRVDVHVTASVTFLHKFVWCHLQIVPQILYIQTSVQNTATFVFFSVYFHTFMQSADNIHSFKIYSRFLCFDRTTDYLINGGLHFYSAVYLCSTQNKHDLQV